MKFIRLTVLLAALLALHGCAFKDEADVDVKEAILHSPEGDFEFKRDKKNRFSFHAKDPKHTVTISLFPGDGDSSLMFYTEKITIRSNEAYYQLNNGEKNKLLITNHWNSHKRFNIIAPASMDYYILDGDGLHVTRKRLRITSEHKKKVKQETYHYYIPFTIHGEDHAINATFQLEINTKLRFGVPGMP